MNNSFSRNAVMMRYKECMKNHAAAIGGNATDGCGEFMPSGSDEGTIEALKCSACNCHRNFHRKETQSISDDYPSPFIGYPTTNTIIMSYKSGSVVIPSESDDHVVAIRPAAEKVTIRKRFRTKFTKEQKEKMLSFAEKAGWRMQKMEESVVQHFCQEIGIKRRVLKVWMHNNKHILANNNSTT